MPIYGDTFPNARDSDQVADEWRICRENMSNAVTTTGTGFVIWTGALFNTGVPSLGVLWRELAPYPVTVNKVAWRDLHGYNIVPIPYLLQKWMTLSNTRDYFTDNDSLQSQVVYSDSISPNEVINLNYDGTNRDFATHTDAGNKQCYLMWYDSGSWRLGCNTSTSFVPTNSTDALNISNYTELCSFAVDRIPYRYLNLIMGSQNTYSLNWGVAWWEYVYVDYTVPDPVPFSESLPTYTPNVTGTTGTQSTQFAPPGTR